MPSWPSTVPFFEVSPTTMTGPLNKIVSPMDVGLPTQRRRQTGDIRQVTCQTRPMSMSEYVDFENFYETDLAGGTATFTATDPMTQSARTFQFVDNYEATATSAGIVVSTLLWRIG